MQSSTQDARRPPGTTAAIILIAMAAALYLPALHAPFIFDDIASIERSPYVRNLWPIGRAMSATTQSSVAGRPVVSLTLAINYAIGELQPWGYRLFNQICHGLAAVVLFLLVRDVTRSRRPGQAPALAFASSLLWLVHPLQTETVVYVVQRTELLMALFYLLTLWCAWRGFVARRFRRVWLTASVLACGLGMGSKEVMVSAPLCVLLMDRALASGSFRAALSGRRWYYGCLAATWLILLGLNVSGPRSMSAGFGVDVSPWAYLLTQSEVIVHYLRLVVWPHPLLIAYGWPLADSIADIWPQGLLVVALLALTGWALWRRPVIGWLLATCFMVLAPTSSFVPIATEFVAERRMYLVLAPMIVLVLMAALRAGARLRVIVVASVVVAMVWAGLSFVRAGQFNDPRGLWADVLEHYPEEHHALANIGLVDMKRGDYEQARRHFARVVQLDPVRYEPLINYGITLMRLGDLDLAEQQYRRAIELRPQRPEAYYNLGTVMEKRGDNERAAGMFEQSIRHAPSEYDTWYKLATVRLRLGQLDQAIAAYRKASQLHPRSSEARNGYGVALAQAGRFDEAMRQFQRALELDPHSAEAKHNIERLRRQHEAR